MKNHFLICVLSFFALASFGQSSDATLNTLNSSSIQNKTYSSVSAYNMNSALISSKVNVDAIGATVQAYSAKLAAIAALANSSGFLKNDGSGNLSWSVPFTLTTTGTSGASTFVGGTLNIPQYAGGGVWGSITGTLSSQTDLNTALGLKAPLASPTFTGTVTEAATKIGTPVTESFASRQFVARGNSVTYGFSAVPAGKEAVFGFGYITANMLGLSPNVLGVSGQGALDYATNHLANTPTYNAGTHKYICFEWGINDGTTGRTTGQFTTDMTTIVNDAISKGWPPASIIILGVPGSCAACSTFQVAYDGAMQTLATSVGAIFIPVWSIFSYPEPGYTALTDGTTHPNNIGHRLIAYTIFKTLNKPFPDLSASLNVKGEIQTDRMRIWDMGHVPINPKIMAWDSTGYVGIATALTRDMRTTQSFFIDGNLKQINAILPSSGFSIDDWAVKYQTRLWSSVSPTVWGYFDLMTTGGKTNIANGSTGGINFLTGNTAPVQRWRVDGTTGGFVGEYQMQVKVDGGGSLNGTLDLMTGGNTIMTNTYTLGTYAYKGYDGSGGNNANQTWHGMDRTNGSTFTLPLVVTPFSVASTTGKPAVTINPAASTALTASAELPDFKINTRTKQYATGTLARERTFYSKGQTIGFVGASTLTDSYNGIFYSNVAGTNATITRNWALASKGDFQVTGNTFLGDSLTSPNSTLHVKGSTSFSYVAKTALYTLTSTDHTVEVTSGTHTQTLPTAVGITGRVYTITNSGSGTVTVGTTSSQTFVNQSGTPTTYALAQFKYVTVQSNGSNWLVIANN